MFYETQVFQNFLECDGNDRHSLHGSDDISIRFLTCEQLFTYLVSCGTDQRSDQTTVFGDASGSFAITLQSRPTDTGCF